MCDVIFKIKCFKTFISVFLTGLVVSNHLWQLEELDTLGFSLEATLLAKTLKQKEKTLP